METTDSAANGSGTESGPRLAVIDDDDLSREVLALIAMEAGFEMESFASGEEAIEAFREAASPSAILIDMQMPGLSGAALATQLRKVCAPGTVLLSMSGSPVEPERLAGYDGFLLKPFSADELKAALDREPARAAVGAGESAVVLNEAVFANFARGMPDGQVFGLYRMCLEDSAKRVAAMRKALAARDDEAYRRAAHAIKGGCGLVGAVELAKLAAAMESAGLPAEHDATPLEHFLTASARLERMLDNKASDLQAGASAIRL